MSKVYFVPLHSGEAADISAAAAKALNALIDRENVTLEPRLPLKLHFGERGNRTYLPQEFYAGVIDTLQSRGSECFFTETSVLYGGERFNAEKHTALAKSHGFDRLPIIIADGKNGEESTAVPVENGKYFKEANIAALLAEAKQVIVLSHFKGHMLAGFGGAIKQLSMGFASKGGKMAMHLGVKPHIRTWKCKKCGMCVKRCNQGAIIQGQKFRIDPEKCVGCGACFSICPHRAVSVTDFGALWNALFGKKIFREKLIEYAGASHKGKRNIYLNFAVRITRGCDCEPHPMGACVPNLGIYASLDPVAIDTACFEACAAAGHRFKGAEQLEYGEKMALGTRSYELVEL